MKTYKHLDVRAVSAERSELKEKAAQYPYVIAHMYSDILCGNCVHDGINWDELVELRAFDEKGELLVEKQDKEVVKEWFFEGCRDYGEREC